MVFTQAIRPFALSTVRAHAARSACQDIDPPFGAGQDFPGAYSAGATPFPIPNRAVKPRCADGTAFRGGRVGRCQETLQTRLRLRAGPRFLWRCIGRLAPAPRPFERPTRKADGLFVSGDRCCTGRAEGLNCDSCRLSLVPRSCTSIVRGVRGLAPAG